MRIPFLGGSGAGRSVSVNATRTVNLYATLDPEGKNQIALYGTPGLVAFASMTAGAGRGLLEADNGRCFAVVGSTFYEISSAGVATSRGTLTTSTGMVSMAENGVHVCIVDGTKGYRFTLATNVFETITDPDFPVASRVSFADGYFLLNEVGTGRIWITSLYGTDVDALDFTTAEGAPDDVVTHIVDHREWWAIGSKSAEVYQNTGNADFPYERLGGAFIEMGCAAAHSVAKADNSVLWLSQDERGQGFVVRADGYRPVIVSTRAVEYAIGQYSTISDAVGYTYQQGGHTFYVLSFPTANATWCLDITTGLWHERAYWSNGAESRHRVIAHAFVFGKHLGLDHSNGKLYEMRLDAYTDDGAVIRALRRTQHQHAQGKRLFWSSLQVDFEAGVGLSTGQGSDPQAMLRWSDDGGKTWSGEKWRSIGKQGEYDKRAIWRRLGQSRNRVYELVITDPVKRVIIDAWAEVEMGQ